MRGKKVEVSASEMMEMRNEGLSNADIAELLDVSVMTVRKYIGNQGRRMERLAVFADKGKKKPVEEEICETKKTNDEAKVCADKGNIQHRRRWLPVCVYRATCRYNRNPEQGRRDQPLL